LGFLLTCLGSLVALWGISAVFSLPFSHLSSPFSLSLSYPCSVLSIPILAIAAPAFLSVAFFFRARRRSLSRPFSPWAEPARAAPEAHRGTKHSKRGLHLHSACLLRLLLVINLCISRQHGPVSPSTGREVRSKEQHDT